MTLAAHRELLEAGQDAATIAQKLGDPNLKAFSGRIYEVLIKAAKGEVTAFVKNPQRDGLTAWRRLLQQYDPREQVDKTIAYEKVTRPTPAKNIAETRVKVPQWLNEMGVYVAKFGDNSLTEPARLLALKTLVPASLLGNRFVGNRYTDHKKYIRDLEDFIGDRSVQELRGNMPKVKDPNAMDIDAILDCAGETLNEDTKAEIMSLVRKQAEKGIRKGHFGGGKGENPYWEQEKEARQKREVAKEVAKKRAKMTRQAGARHGRRRRESATTATEKAISPRIAVGRGRRASTMSAMTTMIGTKQRNKMDRSTMETICAQ